MVAVSTPWASADQPLKITHGPILGRLSSTGVGVWARTSQPGAFRVHFGMMPSQLSTISKPVQTKLESDNTGWCHLDGLEPNAQYYYQVVTDNGTRSSVGSFRTLPDPDQYRHPKLNPKGVFNFRFEFACGNNQRPGSGMGPSLPAFRTMLDQLRGHIHFAILNGDWLYEEMRDYPLKQWLKQVGRTADDQVPKVVQVAPTIVGVWENYKLYLSRGKPLADWHRHVPSFFVFDDHEILNDVCGTGTPGLRNRRAVFRDIALQAWYDYLGWSHPPLFTQRIHFGQARLEAESNVLTDDHADFTTLDLHQMNNLHVHWGTPTAGVNDNALDDVNGDPNAGVYEIVRVIDEHRLEIDPPARSSGSASYSIGRRSYYQFRISNCEFFVLDTRSQRQMHDIRQPDKPGLSMLGVQQRQWLIKAMSDSTADFLFVVSSVNFMIPHRGTGSADILRTSNKDDAWTVFLDEREKLIRFWNRLGKPVFVLTGDIHNSFVIKITERVWEFASGPHNSANHRLIDEGNRPANGRFKSGPRECDIRWSTSLLPDIPSENRRYPSYCVVQVNNVYNNPLELGQERWVAFPRPQVIFQYFDGLTGQLQYAESIVAPAKQD